METTLSILGLFNLEIPTIGTTSTGQTTTTLCIEDMVVVGVSGYCDDCNNLWAILAIVSLQNYLDPTTRIQRIKVL